MSDKKQEIMDTAVNLFSKKGYHFTSVQEITTACNISKGAFYKHFTSKESMMLVLLERYHHNLLLEAERLEYPGITTKERLVQKIEVELTKSVEYCSFFHILFTEFFPTDDNEVNHKVKEMQLALREWHKNALLEAFGDRVRPYIRDLTAIMEGMIKEYLMLHMWEGHSLSLPKLACFIFYRLEAIVHQDKNIEPLLPVGEEDVRHKTDIQTIIRKLEIMQTDVKKQPTKFQKEDRETVQMVLTEIKRSDRREFLVDALLLYLLHRPYLKNEIQKLVNMWEEWKGEINDEFTNQ
ncbi:TetR/AcrR family transcriptional regulator [Alteribacillus sp. YIM 98480]|uniref:TetR/AcrR family transcriptional regulator n=1 Tax=Alteribacillus sp. YIM 98480 TaxID=2606599 RepID=UPI00131E44E1|nr:TetR/AcrR family transcriptional regulator [Alteribacillus sp. YIM 98480]